ncbi:MAG: GAF domain-containing protein [Cytophagales bacterium]|nr:GAF domain-containing protein [Bernardetiaceae bacterium]MDW8211836.1 GAF domain-containing protein [Cytophagales bacterium]
MQRNFFRINIVYLSIYTVAGLIAAGIFTSYNTQQKIDALLENRAIYDAMYGYYNREYVDIIHVWDLGIRGFGATGDTIFLNIYSYNPVRFQYTTHVVDSIVQIRRYPFAHEIYTAINAIRDYENHIKRMEQLGRSDSIEQFKKLMREDRGGQLWRLYYPTWVKVANYEMQKVKEAEADLQLAFTLNRSIQFALLVIGIPLLFWIVRKLQKDAAYRYNLLKQLDETNRSELFNDGVPTVELTADGVISSVTRNMKQAEAFIRAIAEGNYNVTWEGLTPENAALNTTNVAGELLQLKEKLARVTREEERRRWINEGLTQFSELLRNHQSNIKELATQALSFLVRYTSSLQGALFVEQKQDDVSVLEMVACYAYDRLKALQKHIHPGEGLVGQVYLEQKTLHINRLPEGYTAISAGLGMVKPNELIILPLKNNNLIEGVMELATLQSYDQANIFFLERVAEFLASTISMQKNAEQNRLLLEQLKKQQAEALRAQEEELRQNTEELQAAHEALNRELARRNQ